ncbi:MAG: N-acetylmuramoyl-L-alanine amidase [Vallitaleaceae bacterium]|nr:N-acetylmuramoyl-L-alanine amidase [Vallitaleaceae bacterium]
MKKYRVIIFAGIGIFALGFILAFVWFNLIENSENNKAASPSKKVEGEAVYKDWSWINENGVIGHKSIVQKKGTSLYAASILLPFLKRTISMEISEVEYKILQNQDLVKIHYIYEEDKILFVQFTRDYEGCLQIVDNRPIVVLDPGHGGFDDGEGSNENALEKDMNLQISLKQKEYLEAGGIRVILTRSDDRFVSLYDRCEISNYVHADLFISNHINKNDADTHGIEVIHQLKGDENFAEKLAQEISTSGQEVHSVFSKSDDRLTNLDYYFVHEYNKSPSYLIEYGYADSEIDAPILKDHWEEMAKASSEVILEYLIKD